MARIFSFSEVVGFFFNSVAFFFFAYDRRQLCLSHTVDIANYYSEVLQNKNSSIKTTQKLHYTYIIMSPSTRSTTAPMDDFDKCGRLSSEDMAMLSNAKMLEQRMESSTTPSETTPATTAPTSLASTPVDTSFMTEENMKKIYLPKKIEF